MTSSSSGSSAPTVEPAPATDSSTPAAPTDNKFRINCDLLLFDSQAAALTPPVKPVTGYSPTAGTVAVEMAAQGGQVCAWGVGGKATLEVVVALPTDAAQLVAEKSAAKGEVANPAGATSAYFAVTDGVGRAQIFLGGYWIEVASPKFTDSTAAYTVYSLVVDDLRNAGG